MEHLLLRHQPEGVWQMYVVFKADPKPVEADSNNPLLGTVSQPSTDASFNILRCNYDTLKK